MSSSITISDSLFYSVIASGLFKENRPYRLFYCNTNRRNRL
ncbi:hypothetical protein BACCAP_02815 [Pseudoflavonifractor capillosus ATCC 29799]|uniref:Uncharacterized protein n=1 Tax=Pseudoflavonifractor capillosus ATCC 29799 TaxID=411467 RepID=A6NX69_9FIRM|nr:hypothetical protein BACCAP_02815 [Pseudoflavonifractor capillosus ATCC 29799]